MAKYIILVVGLLALMLPGCSDRTVDKTQMELQRGVLDPEQEHVFQPQLVLQTSGNKLALFQFTTYIPQVTLPYYAGGQARQVPWLILLAPEGEGHNYYLDHGLAELVDELISTGEIEPMAIVCIGNDRTFGTFFYGGRSFGDRELIVNGGGDKFLPGYSYGAGFHDQVLGDSLIPYLEFSRGEWLITGDSDKRGIGGIGTGAYGAFRAAIRNPGLFGSVSGIDGPLDFDGPNGTSGLISLMDSVFVEQPTLTSDELFISDIDSSGAYPITRLFMGGSMAFSPHDTIIDVEIRRVNDSIRIILDAATRGQADYIITDSATLVSNIITAGDEDLDFHMPFNFSQRPYAPIWDALWLPQNLENLLTGGQLSGKDVFVGSSTEAGKTYREQTLSWVSTLQAAGVNPQVYEYSGYEGRPATGTQYTYELMREMLIFHSNSFQSQGN